MKRIWDMCKNCESCYCASFIRKFGHDELAYICGVASKRETDVEQLKTSDRWNELDVPEGCLYYMEHCMDDWNNGEKTEETAEDMQELQEIQDGLRVQSV